MTPTTLLLLAACAPTPIDPDPTAGEPFVGWRTQIGEIGWLEAVGDLDGDGFDDALVWVRTDEGRSRHAEVLAGPWAREGLLPDDALATFPAGWDVWFTGDADGDGAADTVLCPSDPTVPEGAPCARLDSASLDGPVSDTALQSAPVLPYRYGKVGDFDRDGVMDLFAPGDGSRSPTANLWWGPATRWASEPADVEIRAEGCGGRYTEGISVYGTEFWPDLSGDGRPDLIAGVGAVCGSYQAVDLPEQGLLEFVEADEGHRAEYEDAHQFGTWVPDQTGDGMPDLWRHEQGVPHIVEAPITYGERGAADGVATYVLDGFLYDSWYGTGLADLGRDLDGDGFVDFVHTIGARADGTCVERQVVLGGPELLAGDPRRGPLSCTSNEAWRMYAGWAVEGDRLVMLVSTGDDRISWLELPGVP